MDYHCATFQGIDNQAFAAFDGVLLNARQLARELAVDDAPQDIVHAAFLQWGDDFPRHLEGNFAAAVYDLDRNRLLLTRDAVGTMPLYYAIASRRVVFSSHLDDFLSRHAVEAVADRQSIWHYLTLGAVPLPGTILKGVSAVRPAETVSIDLAGLQESRRSWWTLQETPLLDDGLPQADAVQRVRDAVTEAVLTQVSQRRDYRLLLSGGLDSAILLAILSEGGVRIPTLTLGYASHHASCDETPHAKTLACHFNADASYAQVEDWDIAKLFPRFIKAMDSPSRDGLNMFMAAKIAKDLGASAVVTGLGGDEFFAGYSYLLRHLKAERLAHSLSLLRPFMGRLPERFRHNLMLPFLTRAERLETIRAQAYEGSKRSFANPALFAEAPSSWLSQCEAWVDDSLDTIRQLMLFDVRLDMDHTLLRDSYAQSWANRVQSLSPLAQVGLLSLAWSLPSSMKVRDGHGKALLRDAFGSLLPQACLRYPKRGFEMPLLHWLGGPLLTRAQAAFTSDTAHGLFTDQACLNWRERLGMLQPRDYPLWSRFILVEWLRARHIDRIQ